MCVYACMQVRVYVCTSVCMCVCMYACMNVCARMYCKQCMQCMQCDGHGNMCCMHCGLSCDVWTNGHTLLYANVHNIQYILHLTMYNVSQARGGLASRVCEICFVAYVHVAARVYVCCVLVKHVSNDLHASAKLDAAHTSMQQGKVCRGRSNTLPAPK